MLLLFLQNNIVECIEREKSLTKNVFQEDIVKLEGLE